jgi:TetR/AcrR family transcriptional regulator
LRAIIEDGVAAGEFRRDLDVTHLVIHFIGLCFIYHSNRFSLSQSLELDLGSAAVKRRGLNQVLRLVFAGHRRGATLRRDATAALGAAPILTANPRSL